MQLVHVRIVLMWEVDVMVEQYELVQKQSQQQIHEWVEPSKYLLHSLPEKFLMNVVVKSSTYEYE